MSASIDNRASITPSVASLPESEFTKPVGPEEYQAAYDDTPLPTKTQTIAANSINMETNTPALMSQEGT